MRRRSQIACCATGRIDSCDFATEPFNDPSDVNPAAAGVVPWRGAAHLREGRQFANRRRDIDGGFGVTVIACS